MTNELLQTNTDRLAREIYFLFSFRLVTFVHSLSTLYTVTLESSFKVMSPARISAVSLFSTAVTGQHHKCIGLDDLRHRFIYLFVIVSRS